MFEKLCALKNKKGFTLIEMLVVIAIIAVLVAVAIPVVSSSTDKASAATNAANLRNLQAEVTTLYLSQAPNATGDIVGTNVTIKADKTVTVSDNASKSKKVGKVAAGVKATIVYDDVTQSFKCTYGTNTIEMFTAVADGTAGVDSLTEVKAG